MNRNRHFEKYSSRLVWEGIIRSLVCGLIVGFAGNFVAALLAWIFPSFEAGLWLAIGLLVIVTAGATVIFYFTIFRPTEERSAKRLDRLGLEERLITMLEYEDDESYIAQKQRDDAKKNLNAIQLNAIQITVSTATIIAASILAFFGISMTTVVGLTKAGILPSLPEIIEPLMPEEEIIEIQVSYIAGEGGYLEGDEDQLVVKGGSTTPVLVVADDGWIFDGWSDGVKAVSRMDSNITEELVVEALFLPLGEDGDPQDGDEGEPGDKPGDKPGKEGQEGPDGENDPSTAGGRYEDHNQIMDGKTYYGDEYYNYFTQMSEMLANNTEMSSGMKDMIQTYFDIIKVSDSKDNPWSDPEGE